MIDHIVAWVTVAGVLGGFLTLVLSYKEIRRAVHIRLAERAENLMGQLIEIEQVAVEHPELAPYLQAGRRVPIDDDSLCDAVLAYALLFTDLAEVVGWQIRTGQMSLDGALSWQMYFRDLLRRTQAVQVVFDRDRGMLASETHWLFGIVDSTEAVDRLLRASRKRLVNPFKRFERRGMTHTLEFRALRDRRNPELLEALYHDLFQPNFPDPDEQEEPADWIPRLWENESPPAPEQHAILAGKHLDDPAMRSLAGFAFVERYRSSRCALLSYIAVSRTWRGQGLARRLFELALAPAKSAAAAERGWLRAVFAEVHDPRRVTPTADVIDPADRLRVMEHLGGRLVPIRYVQPALGETSESSDRLLLIAFPQFGEETIEASTVVEFLLEYFAACGVSDPAADEDLSRMIEELGSGTVGLVLLPTVMTGLSRPTGSSTRHPATR